MEVILLERISNLGDLGDKVSVKPGYGRNYLIPAGKALMATAKNVAMFEQRRAELEGVVAEALAQAQARAEKLAEVGEVSIAHQVGDEGKLFGSVTATEIAEALTLAGAPVEKREVKLPEGPIRQAGDHEIAIQLHSDVLQPVIVKVVAE